MIKDIDKLIDLVKEKKEIINKDLNLDFFEEISPKLDIYYNNEEVEKNEYFNLNEKNIDIIDYIEQVIKVIKIDKEKWHTSSSNINITDNYIIAEGVTDKIYISYMEKNCKFSINPSNNIFDIDDKYKYSLVFECEAAGVELCIIAYDNDGKKIYTETTNILRTRKITLLDSAKSIRIALKVNSNFKSNLNDMIIKISKKKKMDFLPFKYYRKLGYDIPKNSKELKIACIFDNFTMQCFEPEVDLITFTPDNWKAVFEFQRPHILMVESSWKGNNGTWKGKIANNKGGNFNDILEVIKWCKENNIPTVFWNKEDPVHYEVFIDVAQYFDYIFTTSIECVERYKNDLNRDNVDVLQFAAQPNIHNPIELLKGRENKICFAGSYYRHKYEERGEDTKTLLNVSIPYGLDIYDRNYNSGIESYKFPDKFQKYVRGVLEGNDIIKANKGYKVVLNLNTVKNSKTMFARRIFELLASNTPLISNSSPGINSTFNDIIVSSDNENILNKEIELLMNDKKYYDKKKLKGLREVYLKHTYEDRVIRIANKVGYSVSKKENKILVISRVSNQEEYYKIKRMYSIQEYLHKDIIIISDNNCITHPENGIVSEVDKVNLQEYDYITYMDPKDEYYKNYILDMNIATKYVITDIVGKQTIYKKEKSELKILNDNNEYSFTQNINLNSMMINLKSIQNLSIQNIFDLFFDRNSEFNQVLQKLNKFSIDRFNYIKNCDEPNNNIVNI